MADISEPSFLNAGSLLRRDLTGRLGQHLGQHLVKVQVLHAQRQYLCLHISSRPRGTHSSSRCFPMEWNTWEGQAADQKKERKDRGRVGQ